MKSLFRQFASVRLTDAGEEQEESYMTANDFIRAFQGNQEQGQNNQMAESTAAKLRALFDVADPGNSQLISFSEFVLLAMMLERPHAEYEIAFRFFDRDKVLLFLCVSQFLFSNILPHTLNPSEATLTYILKSAHILPKPCKKEHKHTFETKIAVHEHERTP